MVPFRVTTSDIKFLFPDGFQYYSWHILYSTFVRQELNIIYIVLCGLFQSVLTGPSWIKIRRYWWCVNWPYDGLMVRLTWTRDRRKSLSLNTLSHLLTPHYCSSCHSVCLFYFVARTFYACLVVLRLFHLTSITKTRKMDRVRWFCIKFSYHIIQ